MIVTKNTPISAIEYTETIFIDKDVSLDTHFLEQIMQAFPLSNIVIQTYDLEMHSSLDSSVLYTNEELFVLTKNTEIAKSKYNKNLSFDDGFSVEQAIEASGKINDMAEMINAATINGEPLSPLERYTLAYSLITKKLYTKSESVQGSRNIISVLTGDEIVCAGFASALAVLCNKIGVPCSYRGCVVFDGNELENHANCIVRIEDDKYNVHGMFNADPTWDCVPKDHKELASYDHNYIFTHFLIANDEYNQIYPNVTLDYFHHTNAQGVHSLREIKIPNIDALYPEKSIPKYKNPSLYNAETHDISIDEIKRQALTRLVESFPIENDPKRKYIAGLNEESFFEPIVNFLIQETLNTPPEQKTEMIDFVARYYRYLNSNYTVEEMKEEIAERIISLPDEKIISAYMEMEESNINKNHYSTYLKDFLADRLKTKPVSKKALFSLFKNILPLMTHIDYEMDDEIVEELISKFTPLALKTNMQQKSQE
ncbi:MAG: hypothetical protein J6J33_02900 [Clostridia bacterium]|nr:hypothetical protein [Clostridia bacterium]